MLSSRRRCHRKRRNKIIWPRRRTGSGTPRDSAYPRAPLSAARKPVHRFCFPSAATVAVAFARGRRPKSAWWESIKYPAPDRTDQHSSRSICRRHQHHWRTPRVILAAAAAAVVCRRHSHRSRSSDSSEFRRTVHRFLYRRKKNKFIMNSLSIIVLLAVAVCSCHGISDRRSIRSPVETPTETKPITADITTPDDSVAAESVVDVFTARAKKGGGNKNKYEAMHVGLNYVKMVLSTLMAVIGHVFAFKSVGLTLISVLIQIAQFVMTLKKNKESQPPSYKIIETPWHTSPTESFGPYGSYAGHPKSGDNSNYSPYGAGAAQPSHAGVRRRR